MNHVQELKGLLDYWTENNNEHARLYMDWAVQVSSAGDEAFSRMLVRISILVTLSTRNLFVKY